MKIDIDKIAMEQVKCLYSGAYDLYNAYVEKTPGVIPTVTFESDCGTSFTHSFNQKTGDIEPTPFCIIDPYM